MKTAVAVNALSQRNFFFNEIVFDFIVGTGSPTKDWILVPKRFKILECIAEVLFQSKAMPNTSLTLAQQVFSVDSEINQSEAHRKWQMGTYMENKNSEEL